MTPPAYRFNSSGSPQIVLPLRHVVNFCETLAIISWWGLNLCYNGTSCNSASKGTGTRKVIVMKSLLFVGAILICGGCEFHHISQDTKPEPEDVGSSNAR